jgi:hypothetical protein
LSVKTPVPAGLMVIETGPEIIFAGLAESDTCRVSVLVPAVVGVPDTVQLLARDRPGGSVPPICKQE